MVQCCTRHCLGQSPLGFAKPCCKNSICGRCLLVYIQAVERDDPDDNTLDYEFMCRDCGSWIKIPRDCVYLALDTCIPGRFYSLPVKNKGNRFANILAASNGMIFTRPVHLPPLPPIERYS